MTHKYIKTSKSEHPPRRIDKVLKRTYTLKPALQAGFNVFSIETT